MRWRRERLGEYSSTSAFRGTATGPTPQRSDPPPAGPTGRARCRFNWANRNRRSPASTWRARSMSGWTVSVEPHSATGPHGTSAMALPPTPLSNARWWSWQGSRGTAIEAPPAQRGAMGVVEAVPLIALVGPSAGRVDDETRAHLHGAAVTRVGKIELPQ